MEHHQPRKFVLRTTCLKNGGFRKYQPLPPQEVFQHAYWVLGSEMDVKIKRKQTLFNRETDWMFLPVYLTTNKGLIFVYITNDSGYVLRISSALKLSFEGTKKAKKRQQAIGPNFTYYATIVLQFHFGELHLRFNDCENLRPWRAILLAAHQSQNGISKIGEFVAREIFGSTSLESVVSTKSVYPEADDKDKTERVEIHRHPMIADVTAVTESVVEEKEGSTTVSPTTITSSSIHSSVHSKSAAKSPKSYDLTNESTATSPKYNTSAWCHDSQNQYECDNIMGDEFESNNFENIEAGSNESLLDMLHGIASKHPYSPALKSSKSHLTSEVDVSFKDLEPPLSGRSYTAACKTSPTQISDDRCSRLSTVSTSSYFAKNPDMTMFYSPQIPIEHKPEKVVEEINKQFEPMKMKMLSESVKLQPQPVQQIQKVTFAKPLINSFSTSVPASPSQSYRNIAAENSATFASTVERQSERVVEEQPVKALNVSIDGQPKPVQQVQKVTFAKNLVHVSSPSREAISSHTVRQQQPAPPANASVQRQPLRALSLGDQSSVPLVYAPTRHPLPKPAPQIGKRSKMLEFWRQKETENGGLPISYSNSEI